MRYSIRYRAQSRHPALQSRRMRDTGAVEGSFWVIARGDVNDGSAVRLVYGLYPNGEVRQGVDAAPRATLRTVAGWQGAGASGVDRFVDRATR
jgi:hypothetical protein